MVKHRRIDSGDGSSAGGERIAARAIDAARLAGSLLLEALYPSAARCMGCGSPAGADEGWLCAPCARSLLRVSEMSGSRCPRCGRPAPAMRCETCGDWPRDLVCAARFCYAYQRPLDGMIRRMKYQGVARMADWMADEILSMARRELPGPYDAVVPVAMHRRRLRLRGFNHAQAIAQAFAARSGAPLLCALTRVHDTRQQARLSGGQRRRNLMGAFVSSDAVSGLRVLLIDDVLTTGATALACAAALKAAGARDVQLAALAGSIHRDAR
jgi:ComF family protein